MEINLSCEVCGKPAIGVASSPFLPMSHAYCRTCAEDHAEPYYDFDYLIEEMPDWHKMNVHEVFNEFVFMCKTFYNGAYMSFEDYFNLKKQENEQNV